MPSDPLFELIAARFSELAAGEVPIIHTLLLRDRHFVGHCFRCGDYYAVWKRDNPAVEFFGPDGQLLRTVSLEQAQVKAA